MSLICLTQLCLDYLADVCNLIHYCAPNEVLQRKNVQTSQSRAISLKLMQEHDGRSIFGSRDISLIAGFHAKAHHHFLLPYKNHFKSHYNHSTS